MARNSPPSPNSAASRRCGTASSRPLISKPPPGKPARATPTTKALSKTSKNPPQSLVPAADSGVSKASALTAGKATYSRPAKSTKRPCTTKKPPVPTVAPLLPRLWEGDPRSKPPAFSPRSSLTRTIPRSPRSPKSSRRPSITNGRCRIRPPPETPTTYCNAAGPAFGPGAAATAAICRSTPLCEGRRASRRLPSPPHLPIPLSRRVSGRPQRRRGFDSG